MATTQSNPQERTGTEYNPRPRYILAGTDVDGADHVYRTVDETVFVIADAEIVWRQDVSVHGVNDWLAHITERRGWSERHLYPSFAEALASDLARSE